MAPKIWAADSDIDSHIEHSWVSVGTDHDTAAFAVNAIRRWWKAMGKKRYPKPKGLLVTADGGARMAIASVCGRLNSRSWLTS